MFTARLIPLCFVVVSVMFAGACAGAKSPPTDDAPAASADEGEPGEGQGEAGDEGEPGEDQGEAGGQACTSDADCVPATCCHPSSCVPASEAPDCSEIACTEECQGGTMDCGQGHCACQDGTCAAVIDNAL